MSTDSNLRCEHCGSRQRADFERCLANGWPTCCGYTMRLDDTTADIDRAVGDLVDEMVKAVNRA